MSERTNLCSPETADPNRSIHIFQGTEKLYAEGYGVFVRNAETDRPASLAFISEQLRSGAVGDGRVLSVGCGDGGFDRDVIGLLRESGSAPLHYVAIDPNPTHLAGFRRMAAELERPGLSFSIQAERMEDFQSSEPFSFIHFTHSLYHMPGVVGEMIQRARAMLRPGGCLVLILQSGASGIRRMSRRLYAMAGIGDDQLSLSSAELVGILDRMGVSYRSQDLPFNIDVSCCFDRQATDGWKLLCFLCQAHLIAAGPAVQSRLLEGLANEVRTVDGKSILDAATCAFAIGPG